MRRCPLLGATAIGGQVRLLEVSLCILLDFSSSVQHTRPFLWLPRSGFLYYFVLYICPLLLRLLGVSVTIELFSILSWSVSGF